MADKKTSVLIGVGLLILLLGAAWYFLLRGRESTDDAQIEARVTPVAARVSGYVTALRVADNQIVHKGDVLVELDPRDYILARDKAAADFKAAQSRLEAATQALATTNIEAPSTLSAAQAQVTGGKAQWDKAKADLGRLRSLPPEARSRKDLDAAVAQEKAMHALYIYATEQAKKATVGPSTVAKAEASVSELQAGILAAQAVLAQAEKNLADTKITAPSDGRVTHHNAEVGVYIQPGVQLLTLVGNDIWIIANFKETQLARMQTGQKAEIAIDAFPGDKLKGTVNSFQSGTGARFSLFPPENATGNFVKIVQRVPVKILFDTPPDPKLHLGPGMSVKPTVLVK